jgi:hypothetical protein
MRAPDLLAYFAVLSSLPFITFDFFTTQGGSQARVGESPKLFTSQNHIS